MRYGPDHKQAAKERILKAAGGGFRKHGYGGIGVDGLAKAADVTSGAFYGHFSSKDLAFKEALIEGLRELRDGVRHLKAAHGEAWLSAFVDFYLSERLKCDLSQACALQIMTGDAIRAPEETKQAYETCMAEIVRDVADGLPPDGSVGRETRAWALLSFLSGSVSTLRALADESLAVAVAQSLKPMAISIASGPAKT